MNPLTQFLENVIGPSSKGSKANYKYSCPLPGCDNRPSKLAGEHKLEVDVETVIEDGKSINHWHCWSCGGKGRSIYTLLKAIDAPDHLFTQLGDIIKYTDRNPHNKSESKVFNGSLPKEYKSLAGKLPTNELKLRHAKAYLKKRGIREDDILKYFIGYADGGEYDGRIIIPSYDDAGKINFFIARTIFDEVKPKYKNPPFSRDIIPFDLYVNWEEAIVLTEGPMDLITIKRNVIPLLDKVLQPALLKKLLVSKCKKVYLCLDQDAKKQLIQYAELLLKEGKQVFLMEYEEGTKDANEMGFEAFTLAIQKAERLTLNKLMKMKISG